jgi:hypothetical protein
MATTTEITNNAVKKTAREKHTFMLHDPENMTSLGKYVSTDYRYAALKVASRGHTDILLRRTNTKEIRRFRGDILTLDKPQEIKRGDRTIVYSKKPIVKFINKWLYSDAELDEESAPTDDSATAAIDDSATAIDSATTTAIDSATSTAVDSATSTAVGSATTAVGSATTATGTTKNKTTKK